MTSLDPPLHPIYIVPHPHVDALFFFIALSIQGHCKNAHTERPLCPFLFSYQFKLLK